KPGSGAVMARVVAPRGQFRAIARVRWQLFQNSLRTTRGAFEVAARMIMTGGFVLIGVMGGVGLGIASWYITSQHRTPWLAIIFWGIFVFCQFFPVLSSAFTENLDSSNLLRFPLTFRSYFFIRMAYGSLEPATLLGMLWVLGVGVGIGVADIALLPWACLVLFVFAIENILLARLILFWMEKWLAQRRTREILSVVFFLLLMSIQFIGPAVERFGKSSVPGAIAVAKALSSFQTFLPPGFAASSISAIVEGKILLALMSFTGLCIYGLGFVLILNARLLAQYRGENLSEGSSAGRERNHPVTASWGFPGLSLAVGAVFEKELRYFFRSWPLIFNLVTPIFILLLFVVSNPSRGGNPFAHSPSFAILPVAAAYSMLALTNLLFNTFGADQAGVQFYFVSPASFRSIIFAKNLSQVVLFGVEMVLVFVAVLVLYSTPSLVALCLTAAGVLFALPLNITAGNVLSVYFPRKVDYSTFGRQRASQVSGLLSLAIQILVFGIAASTVLLAYHYRNLWLAVGMLLVLAVLGFLIYFFTLEKIDAMVLKRRDTLLVELSKQ
ncbi:MAG TPA: hypothetical protein VF135_00355, partial [Terriglobales bacterium]